ncbi:UNVERIFIED_CONTAM: hypothetical protein Slati_1656800 [Sesamum latifolium]|uniref:Uncharacterized protein n=1 Tax=Sesamum latifolium TaxID=2727402 RepID=A0AAW2XCP8_9LAMI
MAGGGNFIHRVVSYVANELIVNGLANSPRFQRFAVRTSKKLEEYSDIGDLDSMVVMLLSIPSIVSRPLVHLADFFVLLHVAAQKKKELAEQLKDASKNFESLKNQ